MTRNSNFLLIDDENFIPKQKKAEHVFGKSAASFLQQLHYWQKKEHVGTIINDKKWIYNTTKEWSYQLGISEAQIKRVTSFLKKIDVIRIEKLDRNKRNRTNFYSINYEKMKDFIDKGDPIKEKKTLKKQEISHKEDIETPLKPSLPSDHFDPILTKNTNINLINHPKDNKISSIESEKDISKHIKKDSQKTAKILDFNAFRCKKMLDIWNHVMEGSLKKILMDKKIARYLNAAFDRKFERSMESWECFCNAISQSDFLMGRKTNFKISLMWALKFQNIDKIIDGHYQSQFSKMVGIRKKEENRKQTIAQIKQQDNQKEINHLKMVIIDTFGVDFLHNWFANSCFSFENGELLVSVQYAFAKDYVENNYIRSIQPFVPHTIVIYHDESNAKKDYVLNKAA